MKRLVSVLSVLVLTVSVGVVQAGAETVQEKCDRLEREGEKLPPECIKIPLPENPNPAPQPSPKPTAPSEEEPPHEAWESPNVGGDGDSGSSKPDKPDTPEKEPKPAKEPTSSGSDSSSSGSGSKKPSGSSSTGDKKPTGSSSDSDGVSSNGSGRPDTVCAGEFCNPEDTLVGGTGNSNDRWPGTTPGDESQGPLIISPVDENTSPEQVGTIVETEEGLAVETPNGLVQIDPDELDGLQSGDTVKVQENEQNVRPAQFQTSRRAQERKDVQNRADNVLDTRNKCWLKAEYPHASHKNNYEVHARIWPLCNGSPNTVDVYGIMFKMNEQSAFWEQIPGSEYKQVHNTGARIEDSDPLILAKSCRSYAGEYRYKIYGTIVEAWVRGEKVTHRESPDPEVTSQRSFSCMTKEEAIEDSRNHGS